MKKAEGKLKNILTSIFVYAVACFALTLFCLRLFGFQLYTIMSGSMEPNYKTGSIAYVRPVNVETLKKGDVITYLVNDKTVVTHRIIEVIEETDADGNIVRRFKTQGDANSSPDAKLVHENNVVGKLFFALPYFGYLTHYIQRPPGIYFTIMIGVFLIMAAFLPNVEVKKRKEGTIYQQFT